MATFVQVYLNLHLYAFFHSLTATLFRELSARDRMRRSLGLQTYTNVGQI